MASGTADLQRDLGGAIMQSILGAVLTAGYASRHRDGGRRLARTRTRSPIRSRRSSRSPSPARPTSRTSTRSTQSQIIAAAKTSFLQGDEWAYIAGIVAILLGAALVFFLFPKKEKEEELLRGYAAQDSA